MSRNSLVIVGTGIHVGQITSESRDWLETADKVLYCVSDAATERLLLSMNASAASLYCYYGEGKRRIDTYNEMVSRTLDCLNEFETVAVAYYGHPGFFVYPSHRAISLAREAGHNAFMLSAVSSFDCLIADIGISVASGCQIFEATDLMLRQRRLDIGSHIIILQVASLGDSKYSFKGFDMRHFAGLVEFLRGTYPSDHIVKSYYAPQFPIAEARIDEIAIGDMSSETIKYISTLYIPPLRIPADASRSTARVRYG